MRKKEIFAASDIEKTGRLMKNKITSVGIVVGDEDGNILHKKKFNLEVDWFSEDFKELGDFEERCVNQFWKKVHPDVIKELKTNSVSQEEGWRLISEFFKSLEEEYPPESYDIVFLSDNLAYDIAHINYNLEKYLNQPEIRYSSKDVYRSQYPADDLFYTMEPKALKEAEARIKKIVSSDHNPVNDAHVIYLQFLEYNNYKKQKNGGNL
jgi:hypothetical protein